MVESITFLLPYVTLGSHVVLVILFLSLVSRNSWGARLAMFLGKNALLFAFLVSLAPLLVFFYSSGLGFQPCSLCWWQRLFLFPIALISGIALYNKDKSVFTYVVPLASLAAIVAIYQFYSTSLGGLDLLPCTADGGDCSKVYVKEFGYITIEIMSLTTSLFILLLAWADKIYRSENRHA